jgi:hypothetical protein
VETHVVDVQVVEETHVVDTLEVEAQEVDDAQFETTIDTIDTIQCDIGSFLALF